MYPFQFSGMGWHGVRSIFGRPCHAACRQGTVMALTMNVLPTPNLRSGAALLMPPPVGYPSLPHRHFGEATGWQRRSQGGSVDGTPRKPGERLSVSIDHWTTRACRDPHRRIVREAKHAFAA